MGAVHDLALVADDHGAGAYDFAILLGEFLWLRDADRAIMPDELHRTAPAFGGELKSDFRALRIVRGVLHGIIAHGLCLNRRRHAEIKRPEGGIDHVANPVADAAAAK